MPDPENEVVVEDTNANVLNESGEDPETLRKYGFTEDEISQFVGTQVAVPTDEVEDKGTEPASEAEGSAPVPATETVNTETTPSLSSTELDTLRAQAEFGKQWADAFQRDPQKAILSLINSDAFKPDQKAAIAQALVQAATPAATIDPAAYEPQSELEKALLPQLDWVTKGQGAVQQAFQSRDRDIEYTFALASALEEKIDALAQAAGIQLPAFDFKKVFDEFTKNPERNLRDTIKLTYGAETRKAAEIAKQKAAPRPNTLRNASGASKPTARPKSMAAIWNAVGAEMEQ